MSTPTYRFHARVVEKDSSGYYYARCDKARKVSVLAHTKAEAIDKIDTMMGKNRPGWHWSMIFDSIEEEPAAAGQ